MNIRNYMLTGVLLSTGCMSCSGENGGNENHGSEQPGTEQTTTQEHKLANPNATAEAQRLYKALWSQYGKKTVSGTVASVDWNTKEADIVKGWTASIQPSTCSTLSTFRRRRMSTPRDGSTIATTPWCATGQKRVVLLEPCGIGKYLQTTAPTTHAHRARL